MLQTYFSHAPWLQIAVATIAYFAIGALWYSLLFRKTWTSSHNIVMTEESKKRAPMIMALTLVINFAMTLAVGLALYALHTPGTCMEGLKVGLFLSGAFSATVMAINYLYLGKTFMIWIVDAGYHVVGITLVSIILSIWH